GQGQQRAVDREHDRAGLGRLGPREIELRLGGGVVRRRRGWLGLFLLLFDRLVLTLAGREQRERSKDGQHLHGAVGHGRGSLTGRVREQPLWSEPDALWPVRDPSNRIK